MKKYVSIQPGFANLDIIYIAKIVKEAGFDGCFLSSQEGLIDESIIKQVLDLGLEIETIHLKYNIPRRIIMDLWDNNEYALESFNILTKDIDLASKFNIKYVIMHASGNSIPTSPNKIGLEWFIKLVEYAKSKNVTICVENIKSLIHVEYMLDNIQDEYLKACFDIGHANGFTKNLNTYDWDNIFKRTKCVHLHDNDSLWDEHLIPGLGNIDFVKYLKWIYQYNKDLNLTLELYYKGRVEYYNNIDPLEFYKKAYKALCEIEKEILR